MLTREKFKTEFAGLCEVFDREATKTLAHAYYESLKDLTDDQFTQAIAVVLRTRKYTKLPLPSDIRESLIGDAPTLAIAALDKAETAADRFGSYRSVQFDDPVIHMVIESMGGWPKFCRPDDGQDWHWHQKEFTRLYETFSKMNRPCENVLHGVHAIENGLRYNMPERIAYIGDEHKRLAWTMKNSENKQIVDKSGIKLIDMKKL